MHLNDEVRLSQTITLEQKFSQIEEQFASATDAERHRILTDLNAQLDRQEYRSSATILYLLELSGGRTFGRGGAHRLVAAEIAEKELRQNDRNRHGNEPSRAEHEHSILSSAQLERFRALLLLGSKCSRCSWLVGW